MQRFFFDIGLGIGFCLSVGVVGVAASVPSPPSASYVLPDLPGHGTHPSPDADGLAQERWRTGDLLAEQGRRAEAHKAYEEGLGVAPTGWDADRARLGMAANFMGWKRWVEAERIFLLLTTAGTDEVIVQHASFGLADVWVEQRRFTEAFALYEGANRRWNEFARRHPATLRRYAEAALEAGPVGRAQELVLAMANIYTAEPEVPELLVRLGDVLRRNGKKKPASFLYETVIALNPSSPGRARAQLRLAELGQEMAAASRESLVHIVDHDLPDVSMDVLEHRRIFQTLAQSLAKEEVGREARYRLAQHYELVDDRPKALALYKQLAELGDQSPDDPWPKAAAGRLVELAGAELRAALDRGDDGSAVMLFYQYGQTRVFSGPEWLLLIAAAHRRIGLTGKAVWLYQSLIQDKRAGAAKEEALVGLGHTYLDQEDYDSAGRVFDRYRLQFPVGRWKPTVLRLLAQMYQRQDRHDAMIRICRLWLQRYSSHPDRGTVLLLLAQGLQATGAVQEAATTYAEAERMGVLTTPALLVGYADLLVAAKQPQKAAQFYDRAIRAKPDDAALPWARFRLARLYRERGQAAEATALLADWNGRATDAWEIKLARSLEADTVPLAPQSSGSETGTARRGK
jgi:tetratricopeptide (TPR) repeat protein